MVLYACVSVLSSELQLESHVQSSGLETERVDTTALFYNISIHNFLLHYAPNSMHCSQNYSQNFCQSNPLPFEITPYQLQYMTSTTLLKYYRTNH